MARPVVESFGEVCYRKAGWVRFGEVRHNEVEQGMSGTGGAVKAKYCVKRLGELARGKLFRRST